MFDPKLEEPIIIGGFPGSGTRVFCKIINEHGCFMGSNLNSALDSMVFDEFLLKWADPYLEKPTKFLKNNTLMEKEFREAVNSHLQNKPKLCNLWGFKIPRVILILPFLHFEFPKMKFLHVVRDGRDLAVSKNPRWRIKKLAPRLLGREAVSSNDLLDLWAELNNKAADYGEKNLKDNYQRIRFEDMCDDSKIFADILPFLNMPEPDIKKISSSVSPPLGTIGRWKSQSDSFEDLSEKSKSALKRFGYFIS